MSFKERYEAAQKHHAVWFSGWVDKPPGTLFEEAVTKTSCCNTVIDNDHVKVRFAARQAVGAILEEAKQFLSYEQWERLRTVAFNVAPDSSGYLPPYTEG